MLVERDASLDALHALFDQAAKGRGSTVYVSGEAGIGKTSLIRAFAHRTGQDAMLIWGGCEALFTPQPLGPLYDMAPDIGSQIFDLLIEGTPQTILFPTILQALQALTAPQIIVFEDLHWADKATLDLVKYLGRRAGQLRALIVLTGRSDEIGPDHLVTQVLGDLPPHAMQRLPLLPLSRGAVNELAQSAGRSGDDLFQITSGNPFFLTEILASAPSGSDDIPASIRDAVWSRVARLSNSQRETLEVMSLIPRSVDGKLLRDVIGPNADADLLACADQGVIRIDALGVCQFRHELARLATMARVTPNRQIALNATILAAMERSAGPISIDLRVHHADGAGDAARVLALAPTAATQAASLGAHHQAASHLATALRFAGSADPQARAQLNEDWAYEAGIAIGINDDIIAARLLAIDLWRTLGRADKVALNLRWLSRMHWYRGEADIAETYITSALAALDGLEPVAELAWCYSALSQMHMLHDRMEQAIEWGDKAIALATSLGVTEALVHALCNVGSARLFSSRDGGEECMQKSLSLALEHGFHEQAARVYTNLSGYAVGFRRFDLAETTIAAGIAFDTKHDLDSWTHYLIGRKAHLRMEQGQLREAETIAEGVLKLNRLTLVMKLPSRLVLGRTASRMGRPDAHELLHLALADALSTGEAQMITPARMGLIEHAYLTGDPDAAHLHISAILEMQAQTLDPWDLGELGTWIRRFNFDPGMLPDTNLIAAPYRAELDRNFGAAADQWEALGLPHEAGLALLQVTGPDTEVAHIRAITLFDRIFARAAADLCRNNAKRAGFGKKAFQRRRGPYSAARKHPYGLTNRENQVLGMIGSGMTNLEISQELSLSERTVEHHVSSLLGKMSASNRIDVLLRLRSEPWLLQAAE